MAEGKEGKLHLALRAGTELLAEEKLPVVIASRDVKFRDIQEGKTVWVEKWTGEIKADQTEIDVDIQATPDNIGLQAKREVEIQATLASQTVSTRMQILDETPVRVSLKPDDTEFLVVEGAKPRKLTLMLDEDVVVAKDLKIPIELKRVDDTGLDLVRIPGVKPLEDGGERRTGFVTISAGESAVELMISADRNSSDNDSDRTVALSFSSEAGWEFSRTSPKMLRLVVREAPNNTGNLLVLISANRLNMRKQGEKTERDLLSDLKNLMGLDLTETDWSLAKDSVHVVDTTGTHTAQDVLRGAQLKPFPNDPVAELNAMNKARQALVEECPGVKLTCLIWTSETETNVMKSDAGVPLMEWGKDPILLFWVGGRKQSVRPVLRSTKIVDSWIDRKVSDTRALSRLRIEDSDTDSVIEALSRTLKKLGQPPGGADR
ncbi:MAG: hypothetical protein KDA84_20050, partial [Planctomycetaceae bacterium]|nr:hypothetical protein [Planctomycetaceae bacterium]